VVAYDLLCASKTPSITADIPKLECEPKNLFICGSPLGLFLSIRGGGASTAASGGEVCVSVCVCAYEWMCVRVFVYEI